MTAGRKPNAIPRIPWKVMVRADLAAEVELLITDPMRDKPAYGARTKLIEGLLEKHLQEIRRQHAATPPPVPPAAAPAPRNEPYDGE